MGQLIGVRGRRKEDGRQGTDKVNRVQRTGDKEQRRKTVDSGRETRNRDVRQGT